MERGGGVEGGRGMEGEGQNAQTREETWLDFLFSKRSQGVMSAQPGFPF